MPVRFYFRPLSFRKGRAVERLTRLFIAVPGPLERRGPECSIPPPVFLPCYKVQSFHRVNDAYKLYSSTVPISVLGVGLEHEARATRAGRPGARRSGAEVLSRVVVAVPARGPALAPGSLLRKPTPAKTNALKAAAARLGRAAFTLPAARPRVPQAAPTRVAGPAAQGRPVALPVAVIATLRA